MIETKKTDIFKPMREFLFSLRRTTLIVAWKRLPYLVTNGVKWTETIEIRPHGVFKGSEGGSKFFSLIFLLIKGSFGLNADSPVCYMARTRNYMSLVTSFEASRKALTSFETSPEAPNFWLRAIQQKSLLE